MYKDYIISAKNPTFLQINNIQFINNPIKWLYVQTDLTLYVATESGVWQFAKDSYELTRYFIPPPYWGKIHNCLHFDDDKIIAYGDKLSFVSNWKTPLHSSDCTGAYKYKNYLIITTTGAVEIYYISGQIKFTAYVYKVESPLFVISASNGLFVISAITSIHLKELSLTYRIDYLIVKRRFKLALEICEHENAPKYLIDNVYRSYSEMLFRTGHIGQATRIYCDNVSCLEPSLVILKFANCSNLPYLSRYLVSLHEKGISKPRHTFILFQTFAHLYTRTPNSAKLWSEMKSFLSKFGESHSQSISGALETCRRSVSIDFVKQVAKLQSNHSLYLDILINDVQDYSGAVEYIKFLSIPDSCSALLQHGKVLTRHSDELIPLVRHVLEQSNANIDAFTPLFLSNDAHLRSLVDSDDVFSDHLSTSSFSAIMDAFLRYKSNDADRVWKLLNQRVFGESHLQIALVLVVFYNFADGIESIATKMRLHSLLFAINSNKLTQEYTGTDPVLWSEVLSKLVKLGKFDEVEQCLDHQHMSVSLPCILKLLGQNDKLPLRVAKKFLVSEFKKLRSAHKKAVQKLQQQKSSSEQMSTVKDTHKDDNGLSEDEFFKFLNGAHDPVDFISQQFKWCF